MARNVGFNVALLGLYFFLESGGGGGFFGGGGGGDGGGGAFLFDGFPSSLSPPSFFRSQRGGSFFSTCSFPPAYAFSLFPSEYDSNQNIKSSFAKFC